MKVLFAVSNESISDSIVKKYQKDYKEIISYKNVYYFNAILKEIQRDKTYDRIVISEDLEPFANNDYDTIDKFIFDKLDSISDEATDATGGDTPIILICSDRRTKSEQLLVKLFGIGIYSALLGQDRSIEEVCKLIRKPRTKKEAKVYYKIEAEDVNYQSENEDTVSEVEIQNIRAHYKKLGKNEEAFVDSFNSIAAQYTDAQLKVIVKFLPLNVKAVLETKSPKYQSIIAFPGGTRYQGEIKKPEAKKEESLKIDFIENQLNKPKLTRPVLVPSAVDTNNVKKLGKVSSGEENKNMSNETSDFENITETSIQEEPKKRRGRPKKVVEPLPEGMEAPKKKRGRPKKVAEQTTQITDKKEDNMETLNLFDLAEEEPSNANNINDMSDTMLPGFEDYSAQTEASMLPGFGSNEDNFTNSNEITNVENSYKANIENLLTQDKKIVSFVGSTKNGTSFLVNNLAQMFSSMGINTAVLDATKNKNSYFIYTKNEEELRNVAMNCMNNLSTGIPSGIKVDNNLTVYTTIPKEDEESIDYEKVLETLVKNYSLVLIDCDFNTPQEYFRNSSEIYLVQSMDILTIQPLTAFLRDLKAKNILLQDKTRIVINKDTRVKGLSPKVLIGGMAFYNDPAMSFITELFNKDNVKYSVVPFDIQVYARYLEGLVNCKVSTNGYPKNFMNSMKNLASMVYPLLNNKNTSVKK